MTEENLMPYCHKLYNHVAIQLPGYYTPCCIYKLPNSLPKVWAKDTSIEQWHNSKFMKRLRKDMDKGWNEGCIKCKEDEAAYGRSQRQESRFKTHYKQKKITYLEISLSKECNLSCKMCAPDYSTKWDTLYTNNKEILNPFMHGYPTNEILDIENIFASVDLSTLSRIKYLGGEPFITPVTEKFLNFLIDKDLISKIDFYTNSNCTFFPKKYIDKLLQFKTVQIGLSIDGYKKSTEYSREGAKWSDIEKTINKWKAIDAANLLLTVSSTINALTVHDYSKLKLFCKEKGIHLFQYVLDNPNYLGLNALPPAYVESIIDDNNRVFFNNYKFDKNLFKEFCKYTKVSDNIQTKNIKDYIPNLAKLMEK